MMFLGKKEEYVCPSCGSKDYVLRIDKMKDKYDGLFDINSKNYWRVNKVEEIFSCDCGWEGNYLMTLNERKNISRTELIDRMLE